MGKVADLVFGFGRRVCPGKLFAEGSFFAIVAIVLSPVKFTPSWRPWETKSLPISSFPPEPSCAVAFRVPCHRFQFEMFSLLGNVEE
jgi:hypothetical protein